VRDVRYRNPDGFEGKCEGCLDWFPIDVEFWPRGRGLRHCRVCEREKTTLRMRELRGDPVVRESQQAQHLTYYRANREWILAKRRETHRLRRLNDAAYLERQRAYQREYMRRKRAA
jgi:ribosomal protein L35